MNTPWQTYVLWRHNLEPALLCAFTAPGDGVHKVALVQHDAMRMNTPTHRWACEAVTAAQWTTSESALN